MPFADFNALRLPPDSVEKENDYVQLADVRIGHSVAIWGAGPVGLKGLRMGSGQANVKDHNRQLRDLITTGTAHPGFYASHNLGLDEAPEAYRHFDNRDEAWIKVVLNPTKGRRTTTTGGGLG